MWPISHNAKHYTKWAIHLYTTHFLEPTFLHLNSSSNYCPLSKFSTLKHLDDFTYTYTRTNFSFLIFLVVICGGGYDIRVCIFFQKIFKLKQVYILKPLIIEYNSNDFLSHIWETKVQT